MKDHKAREVRCLLGPSPTIRTNRALTNNSDQSECEETQEEDVKDLNQNRPVSPHTLFCNAVSHQLTPYE